MAALTIRKEGEAAEMTLRDRVSTKFLGYILGCEPDLIREVAQTNGIEPVTGTPKRPDMESPTLYPLAIVPLVVCELQRIAKTQTPGGEAPFKWTEGVDPEHDFSLKPNPNTVIVYQYTNHPN